MDAQSFRPVAPVRLVVLVSGSGTNLQALLDAAADPAVDAPYEIVAVGADRSGVEGLARAERAGIPTFVCRVKDFADRAEWDAALTGATEAHAPDLVVSAGFMKVVGSRFLARFGGRVLNTHPALLPSFPGAHGVRDALAYGAKVTGCTVHFVDDGVVDTGPVIAQRAVEIRGRGPHRRGCRPARADQGSRATAARRGGGAHRPPRLHPRGAEHEKGTTGS